MVSGDQIVYEAYSDARDGRMDYYYINYVQNGKHQVLATKKGSFTPEPLSFEESYYDDWLRHR